MLNRFTAKQYLLFDLDGTISDPVEGITKSAVYALNELGYEVPDKATLASFIGPPLQETFGVYFGMDAKQVTKAVAKYREYYAPHGIYENQLYPGIYELLELLHSQNRRIVLATSKATPFAEQILKQHGIDHFFTFVSGSELSGERVNKREVIEYAMANSGATLADTVMIGDRKHDILAANALGLDSIAVLFGYGSREELTAAQPSALAADVEELRCMLCGDRLAL